jgi:sulfite reductase (NADPH) flavoprotein alpha-component
MRSIIFLMLVMMGVYFAVVHAEKRHPDPDGCFSCHGLSDLKYIDDQGQVRSATILKADYYGSLHGSVPCKDCHRKITDYPHEEKDGLVDCAESCHVKEPSNGKAFTHKDIAKEFQTSAHGKGLTKDFAAGNRFKEDKDSSLPSCRRCHANDPYIAESQMSAFKEAFEHNDAECGTCHTGDVWRDQFSGHILRRYVGNRINKPQSNAICVDCHGNIEKMSKVEQEDPLTKEKKPVSPEFIHSSESYDKTLHGRLLKDGSMHGASCVECHAPTGLHHGIIRDEDPKSSVHETHLAETCGQSGCHKGYAKNAANKGFLTSEMHGAATIGIGLEAKLSEILKTTSNWYTGSIVFGVLALVFLCGSVFWSIAGDHSKMSKNNNNSVLGADKFQRIIIGTKTNKARVKEGRWHVVKRNIKSWLSRFHRKEATSEPAAVDKSDSAQTGKPEDGV